MQYLLHLRRRQHHPPMARQTERKQKKKKDSVFQAEFLAIKEECIWACKNNNNVKIWSDTPWKRQDIIFATGHGPFPSYFKRFRIKESDCCDWGGVGDPLHYVTSYPFTACFHLTKPTQDLQTIWWNKVIKNKLSRIKTRILVNFLLYNKSLLSPDVGYLLTLGYLETNRLIRLPSRLHFL
ncbi:hypothetical protein AVEN_174823-1 [Araneus ventricosus]|uniref:Uncharacterized protein n=1 Tax=Araneus ventricosus TaxID=182803 RepID=A0A4Y2JLK0_ARAVE|nr:hypothetical protein AVEN_174823-1 [Araneus ventricosus]